ncbi:hypothetical protein B4135_3301 [Caldibacillus debilis]|uniref:Uncharacterized protein n=1 Tax=Caldibacillus debilis TaxID=301148 RepID=A0A150LGX2_9BACI|nr:hypothetical protein B4135_3301 [Caldibacillus debilis]
MGFCRVHGRSNLRECGARKRAENGMRRGRPGLSADDFSGQETANDGA